MKWISELQKRVSRKMLSVLSMLALCSVSGFSQDFEWTVWTRGGDEYSQCSLNRFNADSLFLVNPSGYSDFVILDSIAMLRHKRRSAILPSTLIGLAGGGVLGLALKPVARDQEQANMYSALFGVVIGSVAGYVVGSTIQPDEEFDFRDMDREAQVALLNKAVK